jgi:hypothetical protein
MNSIKHRKKGYAIITVILIIGAVFVLVSSAVSKISVDSGFSTSDERAKEAFYIAEAGMNAAFYDFKSSNGSGFTHDTSGNAIPQSSYYRLQVTVPNIVTGSDGWNEWTWTPGSAQKPFTDTGRTERFRYMVKQEGLNRWSITVDSSIGDSSMSFRKRIYMAGASQSAFNYFYFGNSGLSEFVRGDSQTVSGKIFSNGNLYLRPSGSALQIAAVRGPGGVITSPGSVEAVQKIVRDTDAWGRPYNGGMVSIEPSNASNTAPPSVIMAGSATRGQSFDSNNFLWTDPSQGAMKKWGGWVRDGSFGVQRQEPPSFQSFDDRGYYSRNAGLLLNPASSGAGITPGVQFYNYAESRQETVVQLDMSKLAYPANGLIYAAAPVRIVNAGALKAPVTIVSNSTIYTKGNFNSTSPVSAALMTVDRIYHLSDGFNDSKSGNSSVPSASVNQGGTQQINACMVDGPPTVTEINYVKSSGGISNPLYNPVDQPGGRYCWANSDNLLENWSGLTLKKRGAIIHMNNSTMAKLDNSNAGPGITSWIMQTHYNPPKRDYAYDSTIANPPFMPVVIQRLYWAQEL